MMMIFDFFSITISTHILQYCQFQYPHYDPTTATANILLIVYLLFGRFQGNDSKHHFPVQLNEVNIQYFTRFANGNLQIAINFTRYPLALYQTNTRS